MTQKAIVTVGHYDDRPDPAPPNNFRPEIRIGDAILWPGYIHQETNGCMPKAEAVKMAKKFAKALGVEFKSP